MNRMFKDTLIMVVIAMCIGLMLGFVYELTKAPIAYQQEKKKMKAFQNVFADAESFEEIEGFDAVEKYNDYNATINQVVVAYNQEKSPLGYVLVITSHEGYSGDISFVMGVTNEGVLNGISITSISETAGLGMKANKILVPQFKEKIVEEFTYTKNGKSFENQIDAISGATITTEAFVNSVNVGLQYFRNELGGGVNE